MHATVRNGGERERQTIDKAFSDLMEHEWERHWANFRFGIV